MSKQLKRLTVIPPPNQHKVKDIISNNVPDAFKEHLDGLRKVAKELAKDA